MRLLLLLLLWVSIAADAQDFPSRTIRILLPFQAGGLLDVVARSDVGCPGEGTNA